LSPEEQRRREMEKLQGDSLSSTFPALKYAPQIDLAVETFFPGAAVIWRFWVAFIVKSVVIYTPVNLNSLSALSVFSMIYFPKVIIDRSVLTHFHFLPGVIFKYLRLWNRDREFWGEEELVGSDEEEGTGGFQNDKDSGSLTSNLNPLSWCSGSYAGKKSGKNQKIRKLNKKKDSQSNHEGQIVTDLDQVLGPWDLDEDLEEAREKDAFVCSQNDEEGMPIQQPRNPEGHRISDSGLTLNMEDVQRSISWYQLAGYLSYVMLLQKYGGAEEQHDILQKDLSLTDIRDFIDLLQYKFAVQNKFFPRIKKVVDTILEFVGMTDRKKVTFADLGSEEHWKKALGAGNPINKIAKLYMQIYDFFIKENRSLLIRQLRQSKQEGLAYFIEILQPDFKDTMNRVFQLADKHVCNAIIPGTKAFDICYGMFGKSMSELEVMTKEDMWEYFDTVFWGKFRAAFSSGALYFHFSKHVYFPIAVGWFMDVVAAPFKAVNPNVPSFSDFKHLMRTHYKHAIDIDHLPVKFSDFLVELWFRVVAKMPGMNLFMYWFKDLPEARRWKRTKLNLPKAKDFTYSNFERQHGTMSSGYTIRPWGGYFSGGWREDLQADEGWLYVPAFGYLMPCLDQIVVILVTCLYSFLLILYYQKKIIGKLAVNEKLKYPLDYEKAYQAKNECGPIFNEIHDPNVEKEYKKLKQVKNGKYSRNTNNANAALTDGENRSSTSTGVPGIPAIAGLVAGTVVSTAGSKDVSAVDSSPARSRKSARIVEVEDAESDALDSDASPANSRGRVESATAIASGSAASTAVAGKSTLRGRRSQAGSGDSNVSPRSDVTSDVQSNTGNTSVAGQSRNADGRRATSIEAAIGASANDNSGARSANDQNWPRNRPATIFEWVKYILNCFGENACMCLFGEGAWDFLWNIRIFRTSDEIAQAKQEEAESKRIAKFAKDNVIVFNGVHKLYHSNHTHAVRGVSWGFPKLEKLEQIDSEFPYLDQVTKEERISKGNCFGLLGANGCGKSSLFNMMLGMEPVSTGSIHIMGHSTSEKMPKIHQQSGFCPQINTVPPELTVEELLFIFARIKLSTKLAGGERGGKGSRRNSNLPALQYLEGSQNSAALAEAEEGENKYSDSHDSLEKMAVAEVENKMKKMDIAEYRHRAFGKLSGGNKRKVMVCIALLGDPSMVFLDEPSAGVDPVARMKLRVFIRQAAKRTIANLKSEKDLDKNSAHGDSPMDSVHGGVTQSSKAASKDTATTANTKGNAIIPAGAGVGPQQQSD